MRNWWKVRCCIFVMAILSCFFANTVMASSENVVVLGQDLSDEQEAQILNYFGADPKDVRIVYIDNQQERNYLGSWVSQNEIGNVTMSSAYVQPTEEGGIQVKTANLTYVNSDVLATVLITAGINNCNVIAAAPFPVSGTGALTGVMTAYQVAADNVFDSNKQNLAVREFVVTKQAAESIGEEQALQLVNAVKMQVIQSGADANDTEQIEGIVSQVISEMEQNSGSSVRSSNTPVGLSYEDRLAIYELAIKIADQDYEYDDVKETLKRVDRNLYRSTNVRFAEDDYSVEDDYSDVEIDDILDFDFGLGNGRTRSSDSILSGTNDDVFDPEFQSSTWD